MAGLKKGDRVYFSSVGRLVNEGMVEEIQGVFVKVKSKVPGDGWHRTHEVFSTRDELTRSAVYSSRYFEIRLDSRQGSSPCFPWAPCRFSDSMRLGTLVPGLCFLSAVSFQGLL